MIMFPHLKIYFLQHYLTLNRHYLVLCKVSDWDERLPVELKMSLCHFDE